MILRRGPSLKKQLQRFFGCDPVNLPIAAKAFASLDLPNLQQAIVGVAEASGAKYKAVGYLKQMAAISNSFRELIADGWDSAMPGPVQYRSVPIGVDEELPCVEDGIFLIELPGERLAALVREDHMKGSLQLEAMAATQEAATSFITSVCDSIARKNVYRGKVISIEADPASRGNCAGRNIRFHQLPPVRREQIVLPEDVLQVLERNTIGFFTHGQKLARSGRSVRRGLLLFGKPGTGKTYTARWLAQAVPGLTVLLMSGEQLWLIRECCQIARMLSPSLVIMEDVDLVASARDESRHPMYQVTLHQLLNEMDGIDAPEPILFLLTTNRPDAIEPAIASRPGRIDQAIEYPLPNAQCRRRLIELYGNGLELDLQDMDSIVARTEGASPAFVQEMLRKAALLSAEKSSDERPLRVTDEHCHEAIRELLFSGGELTRRLLGFESATA